MHAIRTDSPTPPSWFISPNPQSMGTDDGCVDLKSMLAHLQSSTDPFVLLDDQLGGHAQLYTSPIRVFAATDPAEMPSVVEEVDKALREGATLAGFLAYGAGTTFDKVKVSQVQLREGYKPAPLLWLAEFKQISMLKVGEHAHVGAGVELRPQVSYVDYCDRIFAALERIRRGDIYQVNLTFPMFLDAPCAAALYCDTRQRARAPYGAFVHTGISQILSFSPELFFRLGGKTVESHPMKGTRPRGSCPASDEALCRELCQSPKDRAENLMIVDLIRNDLSRVCMPGTVKVTNLFTPEAYPTVWQLTSKVRGTLADGMGVMDTLAALFPCGSITGAPKIMATNVIAELEPHDRGVYTGAIGVLNAQQSVLNVAIRTVEVQSGIGRLQVGSGVVADSDPDEEWRECLAKAQFLGSSWIQS